jgi:hypothetical protein
MDFVYICREGKNEELRYSLRSIFQNAPINSVWVVGGKPDWYIGNHLFVPQNEGKYENARNNLRAILDSNQIPDKFILMNDDFFITKPIDRIPVYHGGTLQHKAERYSQYRLTSAYTQMLLETDRILKRNGVSMPLDYSIHVPMTMHKQNLEFAVTLGGAIRSVYGNTNRIGGTQLPVHDVKVHNKSVQFPESFNFLRNEFELPFLSTSDLTFRYVYQKLLRHYKTPTFLEKSRD